MVVTFVAAYLTLFEELVSVLESGFPQVLGLLCFHSLSTWVLVQVLVKKKKSLRKATVFFLDKPVFCCTFFTSCYCKTDLESLYHNSLYIIVIKSKTLISGICIPVDMHFVPAIRCWNDFKMTLESAWKVLEFDPGKCVGTVLNAF